MKLVKGTNERSVKVCEKNIKINQVKCIPKRHLVVVHYDYNVVVYDLKTMDKVDTLLTKKCVFFIMNEGQHKTDELLLVTKQKEGQVFRYRENEHKFK